MGKIKLRKTRKSVHRTQRYPLYAAIVVILGLVVALTVISIQKSKLDNLTTKSLNEMAASTQSDVKIAARECDRMTLPGANVLDELIPNMRVHLYAAKTMNESMIIVYNFPMLDIDAYTKTQVAIDAIEKQINKGMTYDEQLLTLQQAMSELEASVDSHYADAENQLMPDGKVR